ncbi:MAG: hypothetical protein IPI85_17300 [Dehalococcoidia bacterium]|nr:hypothetical protein [Dehalococcoidia bacterium]
MTLVAWDERRWAPTWRCGRSDSALPGARPCFRTRTSRAHLLDDAATRRWKRAPVTAAFTTGRALLRELVETGLLAILVFLSICASVQH